MTDPLPRKDNEFIAWYPHALTSEAAGDVWQKRPAAYYVHIPFCTAICDYCGFSVAREKTANISRYLSALRKEIERYAELCRLANYRFVCGHFGGGTPSVIEASHLVGIKQLISSCFETSEDAEVTIEVNPISFTPGKAEAYRKASINRISIGIQSFDDGVLQTIGRPHRRTDVQAALKVIAALGWDNFSLDIIYGVPGETKEILRNDLLRAVETGASHISSFRLEIIPFTALKLREAANLLPARLSDEMLNEMDDLVSSILTKNGYREYGAFNFARPGYESVHNAIAFTAPQSEYVGFGNSSYSFINDHVFCNYADLANYEEAIFEGRDPIAYAKKLTALEAMSRYFVLGVKFFRVPRRQFIAKFGLEPEQIFGDVLARLSAAGFLTRKDDDYVLTRLGRNYVNNVCKEFYVGENRGKRQHMQFVPTLTQNQILHYAALKNRPSASSQASRVTNQ